MKTIETQMLICYCQTLVGINTQSSSSSHSLSASGIAGCLVPVFAPPPIITTLSVTPECQILWTEKLPVILSFRDQTSQFQES